MQTVPMTKNLSSAKSIKYYLHTLVVLLLMIGFKYVPSFNPNITETGMAALGVFLGMLYGWTFLEMLWPSLLGMVLISFTGIMTVKESFLQGFGADLTLITFFIFIFAAFMDESGLNTYVANWFISRKFCIGKPWVFCGMLMYSTFILSSFTYIFAAIIIVWSIFYRIAAEASLQPKGKYVNCVMFGIVLGGSLGAIVLPFNPMSLIALGLMEKTTGITVNFLTYSVINITFCTLIVVLYCLVCKYIFRANAGQMTVKEDRFAHLRSIKMNEQQKFAAIIMCVFLAMLLLPGLFPANWPVISQLKLLGVSGSIACVLIFLMILRKKSSNGKESVGDFTNLVRRGVNWHVVILIAATMPITNALESPESGVLKAVELFLTSAIQGMNPYLAITFIAIILATVTQFTHNAVLLIVFIPMLCPLALNFGINPIVLVITLVYACQTAHVTPGASTQAAMIYANTEWIDKKDILKLALWTLIIMMAVALFLVMPISSIVF